MKSSAPRRLALAVSLALCAMQGRAEAQPQADTATVADGAMGTADYRFQGRKTP